MSSGGKAYKALSVEVYTVSELDSTIAQAMDEDIIDVTNAKMQ